MALQSHDPKLRNSVYTGCQTPRNEGSFALVSAQYLCLYLFQLEHSAMRNNTGLCCLNSDSLPVSVQCLRGFMIVGSPCHPFGPKSRTSASRPTPGYAGPLHLDHTNDTTASHCQTTATSQQRIDLYKSVLFGCFHSLVSLI